MVPLLGMIILSFYAGPNSQVPFVHC